MCSSHLSSTVIMRYAPEYANASILTVLKKSSFLFQIDPKNLDPSSKTNLIFWDCFCLTRGIIFLSCFVRKTRVLNNTYSILYKSLYSHVRGGRVVRWCWVIFSTGASC